MTDKEFNSKLDEMKANHAGADPVNLKAELINQQKELDDLRDRVDEITRKVQLFTTEKE